MLGGLQLIQFNADSDEIESKGPRPRRSLAVSESKKHEQIAADASNVVADSRALDVRFSQVAIGS